MIWDFLRGFRGGIDVIFGEVCVAGNVFDYLDGASKLAEGGIELRAGSARVSATINVSSSARPAR